MRTNETKKQTQAVIWEQCMEFWQKGQTSPCWQFALVIHVIAGFPCRWFPRSPQEWAPLVALCFMVRTPLAPLCTCVGDGVHAANGQQQPHLFMYKMHQVQPCLHLEVPCQPTLPGGYWAKGPHVCQTSKPIPPLSLQTTVTAGVYRPGALPTNQLFWDVYPLTGLPY